MRRALAMAAGLLSAAACTNVTLYSTNGETRPSADRLSLSGTFCADVPDAQQFPVKALYIVDTSSGANAIAQRLSVSYLRNIPGTTGQHLVLSLVATGIDLSHGGR